MRPDQGEADAHGRGKVGNACRLSNHKRMFSPELPASDRTVVN